MKARAEQELEATHKEGGAVDANKLHGLDITDMRDTSSSLTASSKSCGFRSKFFFETNIRRRGIKAHISNVRQRNDRDQARELMVTYTWFFQNAAQEHT